MAFVISTFRRCSCECSLQWSPWAPALWLCRSCRVSFPVKTNWESLTSLLNQWPIANHLFLPHSHLHLILILCVVASSQRDVGLSTPEGELNQELVKWKNTTTAGAPMQRVYVETGNIQFVHMTLNKGVIPKCDHENVHRLQQSCHPCKNTDKSAKSRGQGDRYPKQRAGFRSKHPPKTRVIKRVITPADWHMSHGGCGLHCYFHKSFTLDIFALFLSETRVCRL